LAEISSGYNDGLHKGRLRVRPAVLQHFRGFAAFSWGKGLKQSLLMGILGLTAFASPAFGSQDIDLGGLVINETRTFVGQEFFNAFIGLWQAYDPESVYTLVIQERPSAQTGSQITVICFGKPVYQRFISFNARRAAQTGEDAAGTVFRSVQGAQLDSMLGDPDLGRDELE
jgi:curli production assembly/transport component CsgE